MFLVRWKLLMVLKRSPLRTVAPHLPKLGLIRAAHGRCGDTGGQVQIQETCPRHIPEPPARHWRGGGTRPSQQGRHAPRGAGCTSRGGAVETSPGGATLSLDSESFDRE